MLPIWRICCHKSIQVFYKQSSIQFTRHAQSTPINTIIMRVPQQQSWFVERMGTFNRILKPGLNFLIPIVDRVRYVQSLKESAIDIPKHMMAIPLGVRDAGINVAEAQKRSKILASKSKKMEQINKSQGVKDAGLNVAEAQKRSKILASEAKKREQINKSQGVRDAGINVAEAQKRYKILASKAKKMKQINKSQDEAAAILAKAEAGAKLIQDLGESILKKKGASAMYLFIAELYAATLDKLDKAVNIMIFPSNTHGDIPSIVDEALTIYNNIMSSNSEVEKDAISFLSHLEALKKAKYSDEDERPKSTGIQSKKSRNI